jgi:hypothetical protein
MASITRSVGFGGVNLPGDTRTVQELLNDARADTGLPPIKVDGLVGPETIGAIRQFQQSRLGFADGRVDPGGPTLQALNAAEAPPGRRIGCTADDLSGGSPFAFKSVRFGVTGGQTAGGLLLPKDDAVKNAPEAVTWVDAALNAIEVVRTFFLPNQSADLAKLKTLLEFQALSTHFKIDQHPDPLTFLSALSKTYGNMKIALVGASTFFENDFATGDFANADPGGFHTRNDPVGPGRIFFGLPYLTTGPLTHVVTIIHEAAHYADKSIDHFATAIPFPDGRPRNGTQGQAHTHNYAQLTPDEASQNAGTYACFAIHMIKRQDTRPLIGQ